MVLGTIVGGVAGFTDAARKLAAAAADVVGAVRGPSPEEAAARAEVGRAAALVDAYFARATAEPVLDYRPPTDAEFRRIQAALRGLTVGFEARGQPARARIAERGLAMTERIAPFGFILPWKWQTDDLRAQRAEWAALFAALEHAPREAPAGAGVPR